MNDAFSTPTSRREVLTALLAGFVGVAGSYALTGATSSFVAVPVHSLVVDLMPAPVLTFSILVLGEVGDLVGFGLALVLTVLLLAVVALVGLAVGRRFDTPAALGTTYFGGWGVTALLTGDPWLSLAPGVAMAAVVALEARWSGGPSDDVDGSRRLVVRLAGAVGFGGLAYLVGNRTSLGSPPRLLTIPAVEQAAIKRRLDEGRSKSLDVPGLTGLVSSLSGFYEVDIDTINPGVSVDEWTLRVTGAVDEELTLNYDDLTSMGPEHRFVTLRCVGEPLNGELMDNALWTGVPVAHLLDRSGVHREATHVVLHAEDGYYEEFPVDAFGDGFLAYGMNGHLLPRNHGYPIRALVLGHWGEVNVKWLTEIELLVGERTGYWEERGWHGTGPVTTVAKLHAVNHLGGGRIQVGGHAYAGTRGISHVGVSTDSGETWNEATLSAPLSGADIWRQWAYTYRPPNEEHEVVVRATDGTGTVQPRDRTGAFPSGATGWVSKRISP